MCKICTQSIFYFITYKRAHKAARCFVRVCTFYIYQSTDATENISMVGIVFFLLFTVVQYYNKFKDVIINISL